MNGMSINWPFFSIVVAHPATSCTDRWRRFWGNARVMRRKWWSRVKRDRLFDLKKNFFIFFFLISQTARRIGRKAGSVQSLARRREIAAECSSKRNSPFPFLFGPLQFFGWIMTRQFHLHFVREAFSLSATWEQTTPRENASTFFRSAN